MSTDDVDVSAEVESISKDEAVVTRSASFISVANRPKDKAFAPGSTDDTDAFKVEYYDNLVQFDAELAGTLRAMSELAAQGMRVSHPAAEGPNDEMTPLEADIREDCEQLLYDLDIDTEITAIFRQLATHGNDANQMVYEEGPGVTDLLPLPLRALTIIDAESRTELAGSGAVSPDGATLTERTITSADYYVLDEASDARQVVPADEVIHFAMARRGNWQVDARGRTTYSVWGERRLDPLRWTLQTKANTMANKVAMDDSLLAREYYRIDVEALWGHIEDDQLRQEAAEDYASELRQKLEALDPDEKPILPNEVEVEVKGPDGNTASNMADFIETCNNSIQHGLAFHSASFGRDAGGTLAGNRPAKEMSHNTVRALRQVVAKEMRRLFEIHAILRHPQARQAPAEHDVPTIGEWVLADDVVLPELVFEPLDSEDESTRFTNAVDAYNAGILSKSEARSYLGYDPDMADDEDEDEEDPDEFQEQQEKLQDDEDDAPDDDSQDEDAPDGDGDDDGDAEDEG